MTSTLDNELITHRCDLDETKTYKEHIFNFKNHRRIEHYGSFTTQTEAVSPDDASREP